MAWFERDHTGRRLAAAERVFLDALVVLLSEMQPAQIDAGETALTDEGHGCLIVLMPHRALGGISLVVWLDAVEAKIVLAQVGGLSVNHDSLDMGVCVDRVELNESGGDVAMIMRRIRAQLLAPLTLKVYGPGRATVVARDNPGVLRSIGDLGQRVGWLERKIRGDPDSEVQIRFVDHQPITQPSGVDEWFTTTRRA